MTNNINGIDVSEEIRYCNNCSNLGLDFKTGKFYCSLSHRSDELPEVLSCDEFSTNYYIKRLQEENKRLQMLSCANCGEKYLSPDGAELYEKNVQLQKENEELKEKIKDLDAMTGIFSVRLANKYKQALEEIRKEANRLLYEENPIYGYNNSNYFEILAKYVLAKTKEALNDRD